MPARLRACVHRGRNALASRACDRRGSSARSCSVHARRLSTHPARHAATAALGLVYPACSCSGRERYSVCFHSSRSSGSAACLLSPLVVAAKRRALGVVNSAWAPAAINGCRGVDRPRAFCCWCECAGCRPFSGRETKTAGWPAVGATFDCFSSARTLKRALDNEAIAGCLSLSRVISLGSENTRSYFPPFSELLEMGCILALYLGDFTLIRASKEGRFFFFSTKKKVCCRECSRGMERRNGRGEIEHFS